MKKTHEAGQWIDLDCLRHWIHWNVRQWHLFNKRKRTVIMWINHRMRMRKMPSDSKFITSGRAFHPLFHSPAPLTLSSLLFSVDGILCAAAITIFVRWVVSYSEISLRRWYGKRSHFHIEWKDGTWHGKKTRRSANIQTHTPTHTQNINKGAKYAIPFERASETLPSVLRKWH